MYLFKRLGGYLLNCVLGYSIYVPIYLLYVTGRPSPRYYRMPRYLFTVYTLAQNAGAAQHYTEVKNITQ